MEKRIPKEYISNITKATAYFALKNGPLKDLCKNGQVSEEDAKSIQEYLEGHMAYLYTILLEENNLKKFDLIVNTMNKFYVNDSSEIELLDDGFDTFYKSLFPSIDNIQFNK